MAQPLEYGYEVAELSVESVLDRRPHHHHHQRSANYGGKAPLLGHSLFLWRELDAGRLAREPCAIRAGQLELHWPAELSLVEANHCYKERRKLS